MGQELTREQLNGLLQAEDVAACEFQQITEFFLEEKEIVKFSPDGVCQVDPRNGDRILFNSARARRPHDNAPVASGKEVPPTSPCVVCDGNTTGVLDVAALSEGFTFINKNLFPMLFPVAMDGSPLHSDNESDAVDPGGGRAYGLHFLHWTSSMHTVDWHNMPPRDAVIAMKRIAALEETLLKKSAGVMPENSSWGGPQNEFGFVSIIKNFGRLVGGSLEHGHQQIGFSNVMPRRMRDNLRFQLRHNEPFSSFLARENPAELLIHDYGPAILATPYFMRRPFDMVLLLKNSHRRYLHELDEAELGAVAAGWRDGICAMLTVLRGLGRPPAYNVITHNGPGAGLYFEFLPYTQEMGGFEHLGLYVCQHNPPAAAQALREMLGYAPEAGRDSIVQPSR